MKSTDDLFQLVHALTKTEKRYFRLYAARQVGEYRAGYLDVFDALDGMETYDEATLRSRLKDDVVRYLPQTKYYLYKIILKALNQYNLQSSHEAQLNEMLESSKILFAKKLVPQSRKILAKAEKLAIANDSEYHLLQILVMRYRMTITGAGLRSTEREVDEIFARMIEISDRFAVRYPIWRIQAKTYIANVYERQDGRQHIEDLLAQLMKFDEKSINDPLARVMYYSILDNYHDSLHHSGEVCSIRSNIVQYMESTPALMLLPLDRYVPMMYNYCQVLIQCGHYEEFWNQYAKLRQVVDKELARGLSYNDLHILMLPARCYLQMGEFSDSHRLIKGLQPHFERLRSTTRIGIVVYYIYLSAFISFLDEDFNESLKWLNEILNGLDDVSNERYRRDAWLINLLVHYELGHLDEIESYSASATRFLHSQGSVSQQEKFIIDLLRRAGMARNRAELRRLLEKSAEPLRELRELSGSFAHMFNLEAWLTAKVEGIRLGDYLKMQSGQ